MKLPPKSVSFNSFLGVTWWCSICFSWGAVMVLRCWTNEWVSESVCKRHLSGWRDGVRFVSLGLPWWCCDVELMSEWVSESVCKRHLQSKSHVVTSSAGKHSVQNVWFWFWQIIHSPPRGVSRESIWSHDCFHNTKIATCTSCRAVNFVSLHTHRSNGHLPGEPGFARCPLNFPSPFYLRLCILPRHTKSSRILLDTAPPCLRGQHLFSSFHFHCYSVFNPVSIIHTFHIS